MRNSFGTLHSGKIWKRWQKKNGKEKLQFQENRALGKQFARAFIQVLFDLCLHYLLPEPAEVLCAAHIEPVVYNYQQTPSNRRIVYRPGRVNLYCAHIIRARGIGNKNQSAMFQFEEYALTETGSTQPIKELGGWVNDKDKLEPYGSVTKYGTL